MPHLLIEQLAEPDHHPQAHFLNCQTMEVLRELNGIDQVIQTQSAPTDDWRRFVYCTGLADLPARDQIKPDVTSSLLGMFDHLADVPAVERSPTHETHFPQHDFVRLLCNNVLKSQFCRLVEGRHTDILDEDKNEETWNGLLWISGDEKRF